MGEKGRALVFCGHDRVTGPDDGESDQQKARSGELRAVTDVSSVFVSFGSQFCSCSRVGLFRRSCVWCGMEEEERQISPAPHFTSATSHQCHISPVPSRGFLLDSSCLWSLGVGFYGLCNDAGEGILLLGWFFKEQSFTCVFSPTP